MRVLFVVPYVPSPIRVRPYNFIRHLSRHHQITVIATASRREMADLAALRSICSGVEAVPLTLSRSVMGCAQAVLRGEPLQSGFCRSPKLEEKLRLSQRRGSFDVVHIEHLRAAHTVDFLSASMPKVYDSVDSISLLLERTRHSSHSLLQRFIAGIELRRCRTYEANLMKRFDEVAVTSVEDARALGSMVPAASIGVIPNGVDLEYFCPRGMQRDSATLLFSGKMSYHANVTALLHFVRRIFPLIRRRIPEVRLLVVGSSPPPAVRALARDPAITVTGYLPDIREPLALSTVSVCSVTLKVGIQNKILEAMAMGLPVVTTTEGATGLCLEPGRDALIAASPTEFADHVCRLLADSDLQRSLAESGRRYVESRHRWEDAVRQLEETYLQAVNHRACAAAA